MREDCIQQDCYVWFNQTYKELRRTGFCHVPNGGKRTKVEASILKSTGVIEGWPDLQILPGSGQIFFIEMKVPGKVPSEAQEKVHADLITRGYKVFVCDNLEEFKRIVIDNLK